VDLTQGFQHTRQVLYHLNYASRLFVFILFSRMGFFTFVAQAALEPVILLPLPPRWLGLQTCFNLPGQHGYFTSKRQVWGSAKNSGYNANLGLVSTPMKMKASTMHEPEWAAAESERGGGS
jgi:hypothetical protein